MNKRDFFNISIRGMVAYCVLCLENYVLEAYTNHDFAPVLRLAWDIVGPEGHIDQSAVHYMVEGLLSPVKIVDKVFADF